MQQDLACEVYETAHLLWHLQRDRNPTFGQRSVEALHGCAERLDNRQRAGEVNTLSKLWQRDVELRFKHAVRPVEERLRPIGLMQQAPERYVCSAEQRHLVDYTVGLAPSDVFHRY